jgi:ABC-2 type transport system ATP-binding protein
MEKHSNSPLEVRELVRDFGKLRAVDHLSLEINRGEILGFLGPNGAGKTTAIRMMCGLLKPSSGQIFIDGKQIAVQKGSKQHAMVGICPQENILWPKLSCFEQLVFSARMYDIPGQTARERADQMLLLMGLQDKRNKMASTLSGGMKRRMNVILALMHDPDILVFDEPEAGLDPQSRVLVREFIRSLARKKTVIMTTHNMDEAERLADRVAIIDSGKLLQLDTPGNLKRSIGAGDTLELSLQSNEPSGYNAIASSLEQLGFAIHLEDHQITIRGMDLIPRIHEIYLLLEKGGARVTKMQVRENTLEDVFIHLTGKTLRE